jgi:large subunit ribosomal protein L3
VDLFKSGDRIDVTGRSIGKGFQGGVKRWHWKGGPQTHGSMSHRAPGSIGSSTNPSRVFKGHHLPGRMGNRRITTQALEVVRVDVEQGLLLVKGAVPGFDRGIVLVRKSRKPPRVPLAQRPQQKKKRAAPAAPAPAAKDKKAKGK